MYTLDTNTIIYFLKDDRLAVDFLEDIFEQNVPVYISSIVEAELFSFKHLNQKEIYAIEKILKTVVTISLDSRVARVAGFLRRFYNIRLPDSIIAATALLTGTTLVTRNIRDFKNIPNLLIESI